MALGKLHVPVLHPSATVPKRVSMPPRLDDPLPPETPEPKLDVPLSPPVSLRWILFGSTAMIVGLVLGFIMSSLGK